MKQRGEKKMSSTKTTPFKLNINNFKTFFYFALVGGFGVIVNTAILYLLTEFAGLNYLVASAIATETAIISNFIGNNYITFKDSKNHYSLGRKFLSFQIISMISLVGTVFFLWLFVSTFGDDLLLLWNVLAIVIMFVANFVLNSAYTWKIKPIAGAKDPAPAHYIFEAGPHHQPRRSREKESSPFLGMFLVGLVIFIIALSLPLASAAKHRDNDNDNVEKKIQKMLEKAQKEQERNEDSDDNEGSSADDDEEETVSNPPPVVSNDDDSSSSDNEEPSVPDYNNAGSDNEVVINDDSSLPSNNDNSGSSSSDDTSSGSQNEFVVTTTTTSSGSSSNEVVISDDSERSSSDDDDDSSSRSTRISSSGDLVEDDDMSPRMNAALLALALEKNEEPEGLDGLDQLNDVLDAGTGSIVAVTHLGYHPSSNKEVVVYTSASAGSFSVKTSGGTVVATLPLARPTNYNGNAVNCQGNMPCLIGDFSSVTAPGTYYIEALGSQSRQFTISESVFSSTIPVFFEFFNAQLQQGSAYHADMHSGYSPAFSAMSDGSFIMESDQAGLSLIRLGSAYRRNPALFQFDNYNILSSGKPDVQEYILGYVKYLEGMQGVEVQEGNGPNSVRLGSGMVINNIFVPGPTDLTTMDVFIPTNPPTKLQSASVKSLCGADDGSSAWIDCIQNAAEVYKCQVDEPCLNMTYNDRMGTVTSNPAANGYGVSKGWGYEFGCYFDVDMQSGNFNNGVNPCHIFYSDDSRYYSTVALLGFLEAYPAVNDYSSSEGQALLARAVATKNYIDSNYPAFSGGSSDVGFYGAALFLLYDYTGDASYLTAAYNARTSVSTTFISDMTRGNEFYWEEYARHKADITSAGLTYQYNSQNPEEFFRNKIYHDYKDAGPSSMGNNGERVFQFDNNIQFQNSRYILTEGLLGTKTLELAPNPESFVRTVSHNQLAWITGMNLIQNEVSFNSPVSSMSFIFGIGDYPEEFHSRWLVDTGYSDETNGEVVGARGTGYQFFDEASGEYVYLDGVAYILDSELGAMGNSWRGESPVTQIVAGTSFKNGKDYIPGWINGPFPSSADQDTIFNYHDTANTYEFTETTNEMVATAVEYYAYLDGQLNNRPRHALGGEVVVIPPVNNTNVTLPPVNNTNVTLPPSNSTTNTTVPTNNSTVTSGSGAKIMSSSTSLGSGRYMREDSNATFTVNSNATNTITWYVDGIEQTTTVGQSVSFTWAPGVLFLPRAPNYLNTEASVVSAVSPSESVNWTITVEDVINPYFSAIDDSGDVLGAVDAKLHVMTNNKFFSFSGVDVTLSSSSGDVVHQLVSFASNSSETDWHVYIPQMPEGNTYITKVVGYTSTNATVVYELGPSRAHYRTTTSGGSGGGSSGDDDDDYWKRSRSGGSGSTSGAGMKLVYVLFGKDVIGPGEKQTIKLDAEYFGTGLDSVTAEIVSEGGKVITVELERTSGDEYYGTWEGTFDGMVDEGEYVVKSVTLTGGRASKDFTVQDRKFYFVSEESLKAMNAHLEVVYAVLSNSQVTRGATVTITVDARDGLGVTSATALVASNRGELFDVPLSMTKGSANYGTWTGAFVANNSDTTYTVKSVALSNKNDTVAHALTDRSVYVRAGPSQRNLNGITGEVVLSPFAADYWIESLKDPMGPTILGFALMFIVIGAILFVNKNSPTV
jgi:putative flippase GtrA